jgi:predicted glycoside hydrolase/deacetylase ChbG (UPF0249 family)
MKKRLIVNADGFGFTYGVNKGIRETVESGIVTSISALANMPYINEITSLADKYPNISIGVHFNLLVGKPLSLQEKVPSLVNGKGEFLRGQFARKLLKGKVKRAEIVRELDKQVEKLAKLGIKPISHFSGYQTKHLYPLFFGAALEVAKRWNIKRMRTYKRYLFVEGNLRIPTIVRYYIMHPIRIATHTHGRYLTYVAHSRGIKTAHRSISLGFVDKTKESSLDTFVSLIKNLPVGINEIRVHPGYPDEKLSQYSSYVKERKIEVDILKNYKMKKVIQENNVELISFKEII